MLIDNAESARKALINNVFSNATPDDKKVAVKNFEDALGVSFKKKIIWIVTGIFIVSVLTLWIGLGFIYFNEIDFLEKKIITPSERVIDGKVVFALIAATVTQVAVSFGLMMKYLFTSDIKSPSSNTNAVKSP